MPCSVIKKLRGHCHGIGEKFAYVSLIICIFLFYCSFLETKPIVMNNEKTVYAAWCREPLACQANCLGSNFAVD